MRKAFSAPILLLFVFGCHQPDRICPGLYSGDDVDFSGTAYIVPSGSVTLLYNEECVVGARGDDAFHAAVAEAWKSGLYDYKLDNQGLPHKRIKEIQLSVRGRATPDADGQAYTIRVENYSIP